jgi:outer membrane protein OmpA-like peptidoglycan-associated protein
MNSALSSPFLEAPSVLARSEPAGPAAPGREMPVQSPFLSETPAGAAEEPPRLEFDLPQAGWQAVVLRALFNGERRVNSLIRIGREAGGPSAQVVRASVLGLLRVPFPTASQTGGVLCEQRVRRMAPAQPDRPRMFFTGRYESQRVGQGSRYFWAINQAGTTVIAIRTLRTHGDHSREYRQLRGDVQADGTVVLFQADAPAAFWGTLQMQADRTLRWLNGSYIGTDGQRVFVDGNAERDEVLRLSDTRPTMMESLYKSSDHYLSVLLQQREWFPLTPASHDFVQEGARSDTLRDLLASYLDTPMGITYAEKQAKQTAAALVVNYIAHLLWDGQAAKRPPILALRPSLGAFGRHARTQLPHGLHNNAVLGRHVAKLWLAHEKLNHRSEKRSFLDWLIKLIDERQSVELARLLDLRLARSTATTHRYRLRLSVAGFGFFAGYAEGHLRVDKLSAPVWPGGTMVYDVTAGSLGKPKFPSREEVFDLLVITAEEWTQDDFEGTLWLGELTASAGMRRVKPGVSVIGGYLRSKNGMSIALQDAEVFVKPGGSGSQSNKPKFKVRAEGMVGTVRRRSDFVLDLSTPHAASRPVSGQLVSATHFCHGSSLLTAAGRQLLRVVCADQLAALASPTSRITIIGHTDRTDTDARNAELSRLRAHNVKVALQDILGAALKVDVETIQTQGMGEWMAKLRGRVDQVRNPGDRRVDLLINATLVAQFR